MPKFFDPRMRAIRLAGAKFGFGGKAKNKNKTKKIKGDMLKRKPNPHKQLGDDINLHQQMMRIENTVEAVSKRIKERAGRIKATAKRINSGKIKTLGGVKKQLNPESPKEKRARTLRELKAKANRPRSRRRDDN